MNTHEKLLPCPFCGGEVQFRKALWPSDGNTDAIIHAAPSECGLSHFDIGTTDESVIAAWNRRTPPAAVPDGLVLVPREPTEEMLEAGLNWYLHVKYETYPLSRGVWRAMISAAPAAPTEASDE